MPKTTTELHHQGSFCLFFDYCRCQSQEPTIIPGLLYLREFREAKEVTPSCLSPPLEVEWQDTRTSRSDVTKSQSLHHCAFQKSKGSSLLTVSVTKGVGLLARDFWNPHCGRRRGLWLSASQPLQYVQNGVGVRGQACISRKKGRGLGVLCAVIWGAAWEVGLHNWKEVEWAT